MPAIDVCEPPIIRALQKAGWTIADRSFTVSFDEDRYLYADLLLEQSGQRSVVVEVKCFTDSRRQLDEFYRAVGQVQVYRNALRLASLPYPVFLAIPEAVYQVFFQITVIRETLLDTRVRLVVVDLEAEEIVTWQL